MNDTTDIDEISFRALTVHKTNAGFNLQIDRSSISSLEPDEVLIKVKFSTLNYKDKLVCSGNPGLVRRYPHIAGIDAGGIVERSNSAKFRPGDFVFVIATPLGVARAGGLSEYIKVPSEWVQVLPTGLDLKDALVFGTAGFTAAIAIQKLELDKFKRKDGEVLVTGATGGVGLIACYLLASIGYNVYAVSGNDHAQEILASIGVSHTVSREEFLAQPNFPLLKPRFIAAIDCVGGNYLSLACRQVLPGSSVAAIGLIDGEFVNLSVMPFILRGINLIGINAETTDRQTRKKVWGQIANIINKKGVENLFFNCSLKEAMDILKGVKKDFPIGRALVKL